MSGPVCNDTHGQRCSRFLRVPMARLPRHDHQECRSRKPRPLLANVSNQRCNLREVRTRSFGFAFPEQDHALAVGDVDRGVRDIPKCAQVSRHPLSSSDILCRPGDIVCLVLVPNCARVRVEHRRYVNVTFLHFSNWKTSDMLEQEAEDGKEEDEEFGSGGRHTSRAVVGVNGS